VCWWESAGGRVDSSPCFMIPYICLYYPRLLQGWGLQKAMDLYSYRVGKNLFPDMTGSTGFRKRSEVRAPASGSGRSCSDVLMRN